MLRSIDDQRYVELCKWTKYAVSKHQKCSISSLNAHVMKNNINRCKSNKSIDRHNLYWTKRCSRKVLTYKSVISGRKWRRILKNITWPEVHEKDSQQNVGTQVSHFCLSAMFYFSIYGKQHVQTWSTTSGEYADCKMRCVPSLSISIFGAICES